MSLKADEVLVDQGTVSDLEDGDSNVRNRMVALADMLENENVLTAQVTVTALTTSGVRRYEIAVDNENARLHQTSLDVRADIVTGSELYRHLSMYGTTGTMIDKEVNQLNVWLGPVEEQRVIQITGDVHESMDMRLTKLF